MPRSACSLPAIYLCVFISSIWSISVRPSSADIIYFRDGMRTVCDGRAWEEKDEVRCEHEGGLLIYPKADVTSIEKTLPLVTPSEAPPDAPPPPPAPAPAKTADMPPPAKSPPRVLPAPPSMPRPDSGLLFYDPRRPKKYWSSATRHHDTFREASSALAAEYDRPREWVERHLADSNDLVEIRRSLEEALSGGGDNPAPPPEGASQISMEFYNPRRPQPYWTSDTARHTTYADAVQALAHEFSETPEWVEANMGESNDIHEIRRSLSRVKSGE
jgi:hypothetical protein